MSPNDTDPLQDAPFGPTSASTEPGAPPALATAPDATDPDGSSGVREGALAVALLADLARAPLPANGVLETAGHSAAAAAVGPHRPAPAAAVAPSEPAVVINTTQPLPIASPVRAPTAPAALRANDTKVDPLPRPRAIQNTTVPSARAMKRDRALVAMVLAIGATVAIAIVVVGFARRGTEAGSGEATATAPPAASAPSAAPPAVAAAPPKIGSAAPAPIAASPPEAKVEPESSGAPAAAVASPPRVGVPRSSPPPPSAAVMPSSVAAPAPARPSVTSPAASHPRPSPGGFVEPDRTF